MFNLFKYSYKLTQTSKPDVVYLTPTAETWMKALAPSAIFGVGFVGLMIYGKFVERQADKLLSELDNDPDVP